MQKLLKYPNTNKGSKSTGLIIDCSKWIKRKFTTSLMDEQRVVMETYRMLKKTGKNRTFWSGIWRVKKEHNKEAKWLSNLNEEMVKFEQQNVVINKDKIKKQCSKMPNWKAPGHDGARILDKKT